MGKGSNERKCIMTDILRQAPAISAARKHALPVANSDNLLDVQAICNKTGFCKQVAARLMKETGRCVRIHGKLFVLESSFIDYVRDLEANEAC